MDSEAVRDLESIVLEPDPLEGAEELAGREAIEAQAVFAMEEEKIDLRKQWLNAK